ncbi:hypothetical protein IAU60_000949 [Kwoniella sp. DSM 27419]
MLERLTYLHYLTPVILLLPLAFVLRPLPPPPPPLPGIRPITVKTVTPRRSLISTCLLVLTIASFGDIAILVADLLTARARHGQDIPPHLVGGALGGEVIYSIGGLVIWGVTLSGAWWRDRWGGKSLAWLAVLALICEIPNLVGLVRIETHTHGYDKIFTILSIVPSALRLLLLPIVLAAIAYPRVSFEPADETTRLLADSNGQSTGDARRDPSSGEYGTFDAESQDQDHDQAKSTNAPPTGAPPTPTQGGTNAATATAANGTTNTEGQTKKIKINKKLGMKKEEKKDLKFKEAWPKFKMLIPRLWPSTNLKLQFFVVMTGIMIAFDRVLTPLAPISLGFLIRGLTERNTGDVWKWLSIYLVLRLLNAYGILSAAQQAFWIPVVQYTDREMQSLCFNHLLDLSLAYHTKRNTGEVMRIIERGSAINELFRTVLFQIIPTFADIVIGFSVFIWLFGPLMTGAVLLIMIPYMIFTFFSTQLRKKLRKTYIERDIEQRGIVSDVLNNWESVKYFTAERREFDRFMGAVAACQEVDYQWTMGYQAIYAIQSLLLTLGFAVGAVILSWNIMRGKGDSALFVIFIQYYSSFTSPLNQLSSLYRSIQTDLTDSEKMLALLNEKTEIKDQPDAKELIITDGVIEFDNVSFTYDGKLEALKNVSFKVGKGESMALIGETGSGKSTILRLLYRFYDVTSGTIYIDGQDISKVTQASLRRAIGIVPQDSVLWNDSIGANIAYGRPEASDEEIIAAAMAGRLHDKIMAFDEGYDTVVGERGVRLSGGEKQRVSLSRMFLKSPAILVLDEATSALDTETEREIQKSLAALAKGRSSLSIAHRLSTIINSDRIVVMRSGGIVEAGRYNELIAKNGAFAKMWKRQIYTEAELLQDDDVEKVANSLPTAEDFRRAHSHTGKGADTPKDGDSDVGAKGGSGPSTPPSHKAPVDHVEPQAAEGFTIGDSSNNVEALAAANASDDTTPPNTTSDADEATAEQLEAIDGRLASRATGPCSVVEQQDPIAAASQPTDQVHESKSYAAVASEATVSQPGEVANQSTAHSANPDGTADSPVDKVALDTKPTFTPPTMFTPIPATAEPPKSSTSSSVPFPSTDTRPSNPHRVSTVSKSPSIASAISSVGEGTSPSKSDGASLARTPSDKDKGDKRRKRLSSIKGFVRRISDQGLTRSPSGLRSPRTEEPPSSPGPSPTPGRGAGEEAAALAPPPLSLSTGSGNAAVTQAAGSTSSSSKSKKKKKGGK